MIAAALLVKGQKSGRDCLLKEALRLFQDVAAAPDTPDDSFLGRQASVLGASRGLCKGPIVVALPRGIERRLQTEGGTGRCLCPVLDPSGLECAMYTHYLQKEFLSAWEVSEKLVARKANLPTLHWARMCIAASMGRYAEALKCLLAIEGKK